MVSLIHYFILCNLLKELQTHSVELSSTWHRKLLYERDIIGQQTGGRWELCFMICSTEGPLLQGKIDKKLKKLFAEES